MKTLRIPGFTMVAVVVGGFAFLYWVLPGVLEGSMNRVKPHDPYDIRSEVQAFHDTLFIADLHTDSLLWNRDLLKESGTGHVDLPRLGKGNVALQVFSATTKSPSGQNYEENTDDSDNITLLAVVGFWPIRTWSSLFERALYQLEKLVDFVEDSHGRLVLIKSSGEFRRFIARRSAGEKTVAGVYLIEGAHPLEGDVANLDRLFGEGLRIMGMTHFFDNRLGGSLHGVSGQGLTSFGKEVVKRANQLGVTIDVAHASPRMVEDILDISEKPVMLSHGGVKGVCDRSRNLDDVLMQRIAEKGGIVGIGYWDGAVCDVTPAGVVRSIRYAIELLGAEHVALGSDYDGTTEVLFDTSEIAILTQTMLDEGFTKEEIRLVMGENVKRFLLENLPRSISTYR